MADNYEPRVFVEGDRLPRRAPREAAELPKETQRRLLAGAFFDADQDGDR